MSVQISFRERFHFLTSSIGEVSTARNFSHYSILFNQYQSIKKLEFNCSPYSQLATSPEQR